MSCATILEEAEADGDDTDDDDTDDFEEIGANGVNSVIDRIDKHKEEEGILIIIGFDIVVYI